MLDENLMGYLKEHIYPHYELNDPGHGPDHLKHVIGRSLGFAMRVGGLNPNMVYTIAVYHDVGQHIDSDNHEKVSADILRKDEKLKEFFSDGQIETMAQAVEDHRSSSKQWPRSIYGKIVTSADKDTSVDSIMRRMYEYRLRHNPDMSIDWMINDAMEHGRAKFVKGGRAAKSMWFHDQDFENMIDEMDALVKDERAFASRFKEANNLH